MLPISGAAVRCGRYGRAEAHQGTCSSQRFSKANRNIMATLSELGFNMSTHVQSVAASAATASMNPRTSSQDDDTGDHAVCGFGSEGFV